MKLSIRFGEPQAPTSVGVATRRHETTTDQRRCRSMSLTLDTGSDASVDTIAAETRTSTDASIDEGLATDTRDVEASPTGDALDDGSGTASPSDGGGGGCATQPGAARSLGGWLVAMSFLALRRRRAAARSSQRT